jgi:F-type H+-transporting ATPase subunit epsilon
MKHDDLYLEIVTPDRIIYDGYVGLIDIPGKSGAFTILKHHAPLIASLGKGVIRVIGKTGSDEEFKCDGGVVECQDNKVTILISGLE